MITLVKASEPERAQLENRGVRPSNCSMDKCPQDLHQNPQARDLHRNPKREKERGRERCGHEARREKEREIEK